LVEYYTSKKILARALSVGLSNCKPNEMVTSFLAATTQYFSSALYGISHESLGFPWPKHY